MAAVRGALGGPNRNQRGWQDGFRFLFVFADALFVSAELCESWS